MSKNRVIVLDLDETLVHTSSRKNLSIKKGFNEHKGEMVIKHGENGEKSFILRLPESSISPPSKMAFGYKIILRPYLEEFLDTCKEYFEYVVVWSAGDDEYVKDICKRIFTKFKPHKIWSYKWCIDDEKDGIIKPLKKLSKEMGIDVKNFVHIDDTPSTFSQNKREGILIAKFKGIEDDNSLLTLLRWIKEGANLNRKPFLCHRH